MSFEGKNVLHHCAPTFYDSGADRIMYVDDGKIIESGSHEELLKQKGLYYNLYMSQYQG